MNHHSSIAQAIDSSPLNRGLKGADWLASEENIPFLFDNGDIVLFEHEGEGIYQGHHLLVSRGRQAITNAKDAIRQMFEVHGAKMLFGMTPDHLPNAKIFTRWIGGKSAGKRSTEFGLCELFVLSRDMWKAQSK